jgi:hypothetical protein
MLERAKDIIAKWSEDHGRPMLGPKGAAALMECVAKTDGDYIEIGSAFGGSAVMAATGMERRPGNVFCIDSFLALNGLEKVDAVLHLFWESIYQYGFQQRVIAFPHAHPPFPAALHHHKFSVGLIDGNHLGQAPMIDFMALDSRVTDYLLFDNAEQPGVKGTIEAAVKGGNWWKHKTVEYVSTAKKKKDRSVELVVLKKIGNDVPEDYYEKVTYYWGDYRIPI